MIVFNENNSIEQEKNSVLRQVNVFEDSIYQLENAFLGKQAMISNYLEKVTDMNINEDYMSPVFSIIKDLEEALNLINHNLTVISHWKLYIANIRKAINAKKSSKKDLKNKIEIFNKSLKSNGRLIDDNNVLLESIIQNYLRNNCFLKDIEVEYVDDSGEEMSVMEISDKMELAVETYEENNVEEIEDTDIKVESKEDAIEEKIDEEVVIAEEDEEVDTGAEETVETIDVADEEINEETETTEIEEKNDIIEESIEEETIDDIEKVEEFEFSKDKIDIVEDTEDFEGEINDDTYGGILKNNTLVISEKRGKIILPYFISDVKNIINKDYTENDVRRLIHDKYSVPLSNYKNQHIARFKEAYYLYNFVEDVPKFTSFKKATSIAFNTKLNPAIITACKTHYELDTYIDCLENDRLDEFNIFNIQYESFPK